VSALLPRTAGVHLKGFRLPSERAMSCRIVNPYRRPDTGKHSPGPPWPTNPPAERYREAPTAFRVAWGQGHDGNAMDFFASGHARVPFKPPTKEAKAAGPASPMLVGGQSLFCVFDQQGVPHIRARSDEDFLLVRFSTLRGGFSCG